jgi:hypothetical protein
MMETKVLNPASNGLNRGQERVAGVTMRDAFVLFTILLSGEVQVNANGGVKGIRRDGGPISGHRSRDFEGRVTETEGMAIAATAGMLAGA